MILYHNRVILTGSIAIALMDYSVIHVKQPPMHAGVARA